MKNLDAGFVEEKNKRVKQYTRLYTIYDYNGLGEDLRYAEWNESVTFNGLVYQAAPIKFEGLSEASNGEASQMQVTIANVDRSVEAIIKTYNLKKKKVDVTYVFINRLNDADAKYIDTFYIKYYESSRQTVKFYLAGHDDVFRIKIPRGIVSSTHCGWTLFKGPECKYAGAETQCDRTLQRCRQLDNVVNYGGEPAAGGKRMFS